MILTDEDYHFKLQILVLRHNVDLFGTKKEKMDCVVKLASPMEVQNDF